MGIRVIRYEGRTTTKTRNSAGKEYLTATRFSDSWTRPHVVLTTLGTLEGEGDNIVSETLIFLSVNLRLEACYFLTSYSFVTLPPPTIFEFGVNNVQSRAKLVA